MTMKGDYGVQHTWTYSTVRISGLVSMVTSTLFTSISLQVNTSAVIATRLAKFLGSSLALGACGEHAEKPEDAEGLRGSEQPARSVREET